MDGQTEIEPREERQEQPQTMLAVIERAARDPGFDAAKLQALLDMQERLETRQAEREFNEALARLQTKLPRIKKNGTLEYPKDKSNPDGPKRFVSKYMRWEDIDVAIRPLLAEEGFGLSFNTVQRQGDGGGLIVTARLRHRQGHFAECSLPVPLDTSGGKNNIQAYGSALRYGQRYTACALLNIVAEGEDDDGVRGGAEFVSAEQCAELQNLIRETHTNLDRFLRTFGVEALPDLPAAVYVAAHNMLSSKIKKAEG